MVSTVTRDPTDIAVDHHRMVEHVVHIMRTSTEPLTLDDLAETAGLSPYYFARTFRAVVGIPPGEFQAALRFERAKHLLLTTSASITEICFEIGYDSLGTFSSRFKRLVGVGPAQFRELPHVVADTDLTETIVRSLALPPVTTSIHGTVQSPSLVRSHIYVGLFRDPIASTTPVVGQAFPQAGAFALPPVAPGTYYPLAAALPEAGGPLDHVLPTPETLVAGYGPVTITSPLESQEITLRLRPLSPMDPPLLTALPALLFANRH